MPITGVRRAAERSPRALTSSITEGLTKLRSATAGEGAHGDGRKGWSHGKLVRTPASGWLHRLVRLFVIHAFNRRDCRLNGDWIKCERDVVDPRENCNRNIFASCLENGCKPIGVRNVIVF